MILELKLSNYIRKIGIKNFTIKYYGGLKEDYVIIEFPREFCNLWYSDKLSQKGFSTFSSEDCAFFSLGNLKAVILYKNDIKNVLNNASLIGA